MSTIPIELKLDERQLIFQATGRRVAAVVANTPGVKLRTELGNLSDISVLGGFVSLKRQGHLRSCMGCIAESFPLADALDNAASRAAKDDPRFAPITPTELLELTLEVWILWGLKHIAIPAEERADFLEIGRHGIIFERETHRGLLLPGVAVEHNMDAVEFLEAGCRKAGLQPNDWKDDSVQFSVFEGLVISGQMFDVEITDQEALTAIGRKGPLQMMVRKKEGPSIEDVIKLCDQCRANMFSFMEGRTPSYVRPDIYDGNVSGVAISIQFPNRPIMVCSKIGAKNDMPLQSSLVNLVQVMSQQIAKFDATYQERIDALFDLTVMWDPVVNGTAETNDLDSVDSLRRSLMVASPNGWIVQFNPDVPLSGVLKDALEYLQITDPNQTQLLTFETMSTTQHLLASNVSKPVFGPADRKPAVAGAFYPNDVTLMNAELDRMLAPGPITLQDGFYGTNRPQKRPLHGADVPPGGDPTGGVAFGKGNKKRDANLPKTDFFSAAIVPHAGWVYSGRLAAQTLARIRFPASVIIFSPKHRGVGPEWAVAPHRTWVLPGQNVDSDVPLAREIVEAVNMFQFDATAHAQEHAIEVQLPIISRLSPKTKVVGVAIHGGNWEMIQEAATQLASYLLKLPQLPLLLISTDMNHYASDESTRVVDRLAIDAIESLQPRDLLDVVAEHRISMCGVVPTALVLETVKLMNLLHECIPVGYTTSAEASGDTSRVVGYAGMLFR